jgi:hypothetical protein
MNAMTVDILKTVFSLLTVVEKLFGVKKAQKEYYDRYAAAEQNLGELPRTFWWLIVAPYRITDWLLIVALILNVYVIVGAVATQTALAAPKCVTFGFENNYFAWGAIGLYFGLAVLIFFRAIPSVLVRLPYRRSEGWINAMRFLRFPHEAFAIVIDLENCKRVAARAYEALLKESEQGKKARCVEAKTGTYRIGDPLRKDATTGEVANYVAFSCLAEEFIGDHYNKDRDMVRDAWNFFQWRADREDTPFDPGVIVKEGQNLPALLMRVTGEPPALIPKDGVLQNKMKYLSRQIAARYAGDCSRLTMWGRVARWKWLPKAIQNTFNYDENAEYLYSRMKQDRILQNVSMIRVFIKVTRILRIWPKMNPKEFLIPHSSGIAVYLLNEGCVRAQKGIEEVSPSDEDVVRLFSKAQQVITDFVTEQIKQNETEFDDFFGGEKPWENSQWAISSEVDSWLWYSESQGKEPISTKGKEDGRWRYDRNDRKYVRNSG